METQTYQQIMKELKDLINIKDEVIIHRLDTIEANQKDLKEKLRNNLDVTKDKIENLEVRVNELEFHKKISLWISSAIGILLGLVLRDIVPSILGLFN